MTNGGPRWAFGGLVISSLEENDAGAQKWSQRPGTKLNHLIYGYSWSFGGVLGQFGQFGPYWLQMVGKLIPLIMDPEHTKTVHKDMLHKYWAHWNTLGLLGGFRGV